MNDVDKVKGLNIGTVSQNAPQYCEFAAAIAEVQRNEIKNHLMECKFTAVIVDGSIDSSITEMKWYIFRHTRMVLLKQTLCTAAKYS